MKNKIFTCINKKRKWDFNGRSRHVNFTAKDTVSMPLQNKKLKMIGVDPTCKRDDYVARAGGKA